MTVRTCTDGNVVFGVVLEARAVDEGGAEVLCWATEPDDWVADLSELESSLRVELVPGCASTEVTIVTLFVSYTVVRTLVVKVVVDVSDEELV